MKVAAFVVIALIIGMIAGAVLTPKAPGPTVYLPGETVVSVVESPETLAKLAAAIDSNGVLVDENGVLRDRVTGLEAEVTEILSASTDPAPPVDEKVIYELVYSYLCGEGDIRDALTGKRKPITFRAEVDATKFRGLGPDMRLAFGWRGRVRCYGSFTDNNADKAPEWLLLHDQPFSLTDTRAVTISPPDPLRAPHRWYGGVQYGMLRDVTDSDRVRLYAGRRFLPAKRYTPRIGLFVDADQAGIDLGLDW